MSHEGERAFVRFRALVAKDDAVRDALIAERDHEAFAELAVRLGAERGLTFDRATVSAAAAAGRRAWFERRL